MKFFMPFFVAAPLGLPTKGGTQEVGNTTFKVNGSVYIEALSSANL